MGSNLQHFRQNNISTGRVRSSSCLYLQWFFVFKLVLLNSQMLTKRQPKVSIFFFFDNRHHFFFFYIVVVVSFLFFNKIEVRSIERGLGFNNFVAFGQIHKSLFHIIFFQLNMCVCLQISKQVTCYRAVLTVKEWPGFWTMFLFSTPS